MSRRMWKEGSFSVDATSALHEIQGRRVSEAFSVGGFRFHKVDF